MSVINLKVKKRETGKSAASQTRREGLVPGIFYFKEEGNIPISAEPLDLKPVVYTSAMRIVNLEIEGEAEPRECFLKDVSLHPITDSVLHFDLLGIKRGVEMTAEVPVVLKGQAIGERLGGIVQQALRKIQVSCFPRHLPEFIELDISELNVGQSLTIGQAQMENVEFAIPGDTVVVSVVKSRLSSDADDEEGEEGEEGEEKEEATEE